MIVLLCLLAGLVGAPDGDAQQPAPPEKKAGIVRGQITAADTGRPLRRARVMLRPLTPVGAVRQISAHTNSLGRYEARDVPAGAYTVTVARTGYIQLQYGQRRIGEAGLTVDVASGQMVSNIDVALPRGGLITGRVLDDLGEPYPGVRVDLVAFRYSLGRRQPTPSGGATTDDLGQFRLSGVPPGTYYLSASSTETWRNEKKETFGYATTYFPGGGAQSPELLTISASEQRTGLTLTLSASRAARISGRVQRETGEPLAGAPVSLSYGYPGAVIVAGGRTARTGADGSFEFKDVPGGVYNVSGETVTVTGADITDLVIVSKVGSSVSGTITTEDGTPPPFPHSGVRVNTEAPNGKVLPALRNVSVEPDWSFKFPSLGGPFLFRLIGLPEGWALSSVRRDGNDITDVPWDVPTGGKEFTGMTVVVTTRVGRIAGGVVDGKGSPTSSATVIVFPEDADLWMPFSRYLRAARPGADGQFSISGLPAATYRVVAREYVEDGQWEDRDFLEQLRDEGVRIVLADGATERVTLRLPSR